MSPPRDRNRAALSPHSFNSHTLRNFTPKANVTSLLQVYIERLKLALPAGTFLGEVRSFRF